MATKYALIAVLALCAGAGFAVEQPESVQVAVKGVLHEDKNGFFFKIDNTVYDISVNAQNKDDMHKFFASLEGDMVKVSGQLHVQEVKNGQPYLIVYTNDITRLKGERIVTRERVVEERPIVREYYVEHHDRIDLPFVHIGW